GEVEVLAGEDQVRIGDLRVGRDQRRQRHAVFGGDAGHGVAAVHGVAAARAGIAGIARVAGVAAVAAVAGVRDRRTALVDVPVHAPAHRVRGLAGGDAAVAVP